MRWRRGVRVRIVIKEEGGEEEGGGDCFAFGDDAWGEVRVW